MRPEICELDRVSIYNGVYMQIRANDCVHVCISAVCRQESDISEKSAKFEHLVETREGKPTLR